MRVSLLLVVALAALASVHAQSYTGIGPPAGGGSFPYNGAGTNPYPQADPTLGTFCDRLASTNGYDYTNPAHEYQLMYLIISRAYNGATRNGTVFPPVLNYVQGLINNRNTISFFDGSIDYRKDPSSPYYGTPTPNVKASKPAAILLDDKLVRWFGAAYGCTGGTAGFTKVYPYAGYGSSQLTGVHAGMKLSQVQMTAFIYQFQDAALSMGATQIDFDANVRPYLASFGRGASNNMAICTDAASCDCSLNLSGPDCSVMASSTGTTVDPGTSPYPAHLDSAADKIQQSFVVLLMLAVAAFFTARA